MSEIRVAYTKNYASNFDGVFRKDSQLQKRETATSSHKASGEIKPTLTAPDGFQSNAVAKKLCAAHGLSQCVVIGFSPDREYEIVAAGSGDEDSAIAAKVAKSLENLVRMSVDAKYITVIVA